MNIEHYEQVHLVHWWDTIARANGIPEQLLFAIPNGGYRTKRTGAMLKAEGMRAGVPDLFLAVPRFGFGGLFIEMKRPVGGRLSPVQKEFHKVLSEDYAVEVCKGCSEAIEAIKKYLSLK